MNAHIITIGDEILIGQITNTNTVWIAQQLNLIGVKVSQMLTIGDDKKDIIDSIDKAFQSTDLILMTGGLGPTKDDITKKTLADWFGLELEFHQETYQHIEGLLAKKGKTTTEAHREQSLLPKGATILHNKVGSAPGMWFSKEGKVLVAMPGVPYEMKYLMKNEVLPIIQSNFTTQNILHKTILTSGLGESRIAEKIADIEESLPENIKLAYLPNLGEVRLRLSAHGISRQTLEDQIHVQQILIEERLADLIYGYDEDSLESVVGRILKEQGKTIATAESCTGGLLAHRIVKIPGSSAYYNGSSITYSNEMKVKQLSVSPKTLEKHGAVSEETVIEMLKGIVEQYDSNLGIAISGIAGPTGGSPEKPVGTIWIAVGDKNNFTTKKIQLSKSRIQNIEYTTSYALNMIRIFLRKSIG